MRANFQRHEGGKMSKGLGPLQKVILEELYNEKHPTRQAIYLDVMEAYWGKWYTKNSPAYTDEEKADLNRMRASISQALGSLKTRDLIEDGFVPGTLILTEDGMKALSDLMNKA
jgi:hypothetical protein